jgi:hypothetical protein
MFVAVGGGSVGFQIGGSFTDVVMLFMNDHALQSLMGDKFKIGADATVAAGPVGRQAAAGTDVKLNAEILSYSRSKGVFAGASVSGAVVQADHSGDKAMYGSEVSHREILDGKVAVPRAGAELAAELAKYPAHGVEIGGRRGLQFASAPPVVLVRECGLTAENVCKRALALLEKNNARFADSAAKDAETHRCRCRSWRI